MDSRLPSRLCLSLSLAAALAIPLAAVEPPVRLRGEEFQANVTFLGHQWNPAVASQPGRSMVVWADEWRGLQGRVFDDLGRPVSPELTVDGEPESAFPYQIAADAHGGFLVAWVKHAAGTPTQFSIVAQRYDTNGEPLGPRLTIYSASSHPSPSSNEYLLDIGLASRGTEGFLVAWTSSIASKYRILLQELDALGKPRTGAFQISQEETGTRGHPRIAVQPSGEAMVTWTDRRETGNPDIWARRVSAAGQPRGPEFRVEVNNAGEALGSVPVAHDDGGFSVVWSNFDILAFPRTSVSAQRFDASGSRSDQPVLLTENANDFFPSSPAVAAGPEGNLLVLWAGYELDPDGGIMGRFFNPSWQPLGDIFRVNTFRPFDQNEPAVAADGHGGFIAAWSSTEIPVFPAGQVWLPGQDGHGSGVFGQQLAVPEPAPCARGSEVLCLGENGRFEVRVSWTRPGGETGTGKAAPLAAADTGAFWFFGEDNLELLIKVLDGRVVNGHFWVYYGALSDVDYTITVTDTKTRAEKTYHNPQGRLASRADVQAFPDTASVVAQAAAAPVVSRSLPPPLPATAIGAAASCQPSATGLCLNQGRFLVEVEAVDPRTNGKVQARAVPLTGDTGAFWFFGDGNLELMIKVLDGRGVNGRFWVYYGALSDVRYTIKVTDTETLETKTYENARGQLVSRADVEAF